jgi:hypothetical protein
MRTNPGQVEIAFEYSRHLGAKFIHGAVRIQLNALQPYSFRSEAIWPVGRDYTDAVREEVEATLLERVGSLSKISVVLKSISFDPIESCAEGFRRATRAAIEASFSV